MVMDRGGIVSMTTMAMSAMGSTCSMGMAVGMSWLCGGCSLHGTGSGISSLKAGHQRWLGGARDGSSWATSMKHFVILILI